jgi:biopolymer transport protein ExbD
MKMLSPLPEKKARIEIIPLIDIMFFLLASFMLASLAMIRLQSIRMNLPTATVASKDSKPPIGIAVKKNGETWIDNRPLNLVELQSFLSNRIRLDTNVAVFISGDNEARHGRMIEVLDWVRQTGIQQVSFAISAPTSPKAQ